MEGLQLEDLVAPLDGLSVVADDEVERRQLVQRLAPARVVAQKPLEQMTPRRHRQCSAAATNRGSECGGEGGGDSLESSPE